MNTLLLATYFASFVVGNPEFWTLVSAAEGVQVATRQIVRMWHYDVLMGENEHACMLLALVNSSGILFV